MTTPRDEPLYVISIAARMIGVHAQTLRYYERAGLVAPSRSGGNRRYYSELDMERIGMWGRSQGGGLTLATASLNSRLKAGVAEEPFLCNYPVAIAIGKKQPFLELSEYLTNNPNEREAVLDTLTYFDPMSLANLLMSLMGGILIISLVLFVKLNKAYRLFGPEVHQDEGTGDTSEG